MLQLPDSKIISGDQLFECGITPEQLGRWARIGTVRAYPDSFMRKRYSNEVELDFLENRNANFNNVISFDFNTETFGQYNGIDNAMEAKKLYREKLAAMLFFRCEIEKGLFDDKYGNRASSNKKELSKCQQAKGTLQAGN